MTEIKVIKTAHIDCSNSILFRNDDSTETTVIGCNAYYIKRNNEQYIIDTGIENIDIVNTTKSSKADWARENGETDIKTALMRMNVSCDDISKVFITHGHYDHISGVVHFKNAEFYMTKTEFERLYDDNNKLAYCLEEVKDFLKDKTVHLVENELLSDGIILKKCGGHTCGSMSVEIDGKVLFAGDNVFLKENLKRKVACGFVEERTKSDELLKDYLNYKGIIVTGHDREEEDICLI